jgi:hypothetical protein
MADEREEGEGGGGFTVRDRRRFTTDDETPPVAPVEQEPTPVIAFAPPPVAEELEELPNADLYDDALEGDPYAGSAGGPETNELPDIFSVVALFLGEMRSHAILRLGLAPNPMTGQSERDLAQAKVAIDTAVFLGSQLEGVLSPEEKLPLRAMLSELQMLYVEQTRQG